MKINRISYTETEWRTTNPPITSSESLTIARELRRISLSVTEDFCGNGSINTYTLSEEELSAISEWAETQAAVDAMFEAMQQPGTYVPEQVGGCRNESFSLTAGDITVTASRLPAAVSALVAKLYAFAAAKTPEETTLLNNTDAPPVVPMPMVDMNALPLGMGMGVPPQKEAPPSAAPVCEETEAADGTWRCPHCGATDNISKFCTECGMPKDK